MSMPRFYGIEALNVFSLFFFALPRLLWHRFGASCAVGEFWYIQATPVSLAILGLCASALKVKPIRWKFQMLDVRDAEGNLMLLRVLCDDSQELFARMIKDEPIRKIFEREHASYPRLGSFLIKQNFIVNRYDPQAYWQKLLLIQTFKWETSRRSPNARKAVFVTTGLWAKALKGYAENFGIELLPLPGAKLSLRNIIVQFLGEHGPVYMLHFYKQFGVKGVLKAWARILLPKSAPVKQSFGKLMVEYYGQMNLDQPHLYSDLFFWPYTKILAQDLAVSFNVPKAPLDKTQQELLNTYGITELVLHPRASLVEDAHSFYHWPAGFSIPSPSTGLDGRVRTWVKRQYADYAQQFEYWQELFSCHNIGLYVTWYKYGSRHCVIADALQSLGGIMAMYQRAMESYASRGAMASIDVFFGFSSLSAAMEQEQGSRIPYYVVTGYNGDHRFALLRPYAKQLRAQLQSKGATKIMAFFDENSHPGHWDLGHGFTQHNYTFVLEKVLKEPWFGLILKPKMPNDLRKRLGNVAKLLAQAEATGRCCVLAQGTLSSAYPPALAALASDVAVHGHLFAATAGLEAALAGVPTLLIDREGWKRSPLYGLGKGQVVFNDWDHLWQVCRSSWTLNRPEAKIGDWSPMIEQLDPFRDGAAAGRIGEYLTWLHQGLKSGVSRNKVLADAAEQYRAKWGKDKIIGVNA